MHEDASITLQWELILHWQHEPGFPKRSGMKEQMCEYVVSATTADGSWYISLILDRGNITVNQWNSFQTTHTLCVS